MQRSVWTDERLDDLARRMDAGFDRIDRRFEQVDRRFEQVDQRFEHVDRDIRDLRLEMHAEIGGLRTAMIRVGGGIMVGLAGVIAAIGANGV